MVDDSTKNSRRNLVLLSWTIIIFVLAGGNFDSSVVNLSFIKVNFDREWVLLIFIWAALGWFRFRYWQFEHTSSMPSKSCLSRIITFLNAAENKSLVLKLTNKKYPQENEELPTRINNISANGDFWNISVGYSVLEDSVPKRVLENKSASVKFPHYSWFKVVYLYTKSRPEILDIIAPYFWCGLATILAWIRLAPWICNQIF